MVRGLWEECSGALWLVWLNFLNPHFQKLAVPAPPATPRLENCPGCDDFFLRVVSTLLTC